MYFKELINAMGVEIKKMFSVCGDATNNIINCKRSVYQLADYCLRNMLLGDGPYTHLLAATSCPDAIAPSLGQCINQYYNDVFTRAHTIDIVQGCAGGVSSMILASQLAEASKSNVVVINSDAAQKATSASSEVYKVFKNGVFGCCVSFTNGNKRLIHQQSRQYKDLYEVVTIRLGHDADTVIAENIHDMNCDPRKHLGLRLDNVLALKLMRHAEEFYLDFIALTGHPDILILHQVNEVIIDHLQKVFDKFPVRFINMAKETGNCGCATTGIVLDSIKHEIENKKVMLCSFGTGGVITAALWQC
jgi:3-oxoacyl-[acyl-carrier-protein] synthase III